MYHSQVNIRYAKSLFLLAKEKELLDEIKKDIDLILQWFDENEDVNVLLEHPVVKSSKKAEIIDKIFKESINSYTLSFLQLIIKNKREKHLKYICLDFVEIYKKNKGIKTAVLTTSFDLSRTHKENIKKSIEHMFKAPVELKTKLDESLIGGLIIQVDDRQIDLSVARQINELKQQVLKMDFNNKRK